MGIKSSRKGAKFELKVAKFLIEGWCFHLERTPQSGGWGRYGTKGDLAADPRSHPNYPLLIEVKNTQGWSLHHLFTDQGLVNKWWIKAKIQAKMEKRIALLIFTSNLNPIYCRFDREELLFSFSFDGLRGRSRLLLIDGSIVMALDDLLKVLPSSRFQALYKNWMK